MAIVDRIRKLLSLATSDNVNEAAAAGALAQKLMLEHQIELADIALTQGVKMEAEEVVEATLEGNNQVRSKARQWRVSLAGRVASAFNCKIHYRPGTDHIGVMGCKSDVQTATYLQSYFGLEIERLAHKAWEKIREEADANGLELPRATTWKDSFREGAVHAIGERLTLEKAKNRVRMGEKVEDVAGRGGFRDTVVRELAEEGLHPDQPLGASASAMVLVRESEKQRKTQVEDAWEARFTYVNPRTGRKKSRLGSGGGGGRRSHSSDGYQAGQKAGNSIPMSTAKAGIAGSKGRLA